MKIGLIDVDGHNFPNLALMRISAYHKSRGDQVEWWWSDFVHYDIVYMSKVFSNAYTPDVPEPANADKVIKGGTGYSISLGEDGEEHLDKSKNTVLPPEIEKMFPDYSIYPEYPFAVAMTSRGCPRGCKPCHVWKKEGRRTIKVADVKDFWIPKKDGDPFSGQREIKVLDANLTACIEKRDLLRQYKETGAWIDFTQGLDIRLLNEEDVRDLNEMKIKRIHFAWDDPEDDLEEKFKEFSKNFRIKDYRRKTVYCLTNFKSTIEQDLYRIYTLRDLGFTPYVMIYNKPDAPIVARKLQRWCNNQIIFKSTKKFEEFYDWRR